MPPVCRLNGCPVNNSFDFTCPRSPVDTTPFHRIHDCFLRTVHLLKDVNTSSTFCMSGHPLIVMPFLVPLLTGMDVTDKLVLCNRGGMCAAGNMRFYGSDVLGNTCTLSEAGGYLHFSADEDANNQTIPAAAILPRTRLGPPNLEGMHALHHLTRRLLRTHPAPWGHLDVPPKNAGGGNGGGGGDGSGGGGDGGGKAKARVLPSSGSEADVRRGASSTRGSVVRRPAEPPTAARHVHVHMAAEPPTYILIVKRSGPARGYDWSRVLEAVSAAVPHKAVRVYTGQESQLVTISLFAGASSVIHVHGAAFANAAFIPHRACVHEITTFTTLNSTSRSFPNPIPRGPNPNPDLDKQVSFPPRPA